MSSKDAAARGAKKQQSLLGGYVDLTEPLALRGFKIIFNHILTGKVVSFKAFLKEFSDAYASNWNSEAVYGRMDEIKTFQNTTRNISLGWEIIAASELEAVQNLEKCSLLFSMLYPSYSGGSASTISGGPLIKLKFANLISDPKESGGGVQSGLVGTIEGFTYAPKLDGAAFFIQGGKLYPHHIELSCTFTVLHHRPVGWREGQFRQKSFPYGVGSEELDVVREGVVGTTATTGRAASAARMGRKGKSKDASSESQVRSSKFDITRGDTVKSSETREEALSAQEKERDDVDRDILDANRSSMMSMFGGGG